ncbi:LLM class flavin-dependent oxidoreductase [Corynebacterium glutamicum]|uniref:LLM class flavin-dependent oxidoreductase n=1 Tax=Corynebacterium glutamicum TaxID=1718 RepID=UPI0004F58CFB|nr:LLM class flavin-dependent oxidoreductase [Corynebacterium glutamicum]AIK86334.1 alkane 1-monooxygenase [Corynebacterium glutamicum]AIK89117.1 alkane 1-monooxygenase [Corynebacterium glutamicum]OKX85008.1 alkane 1-monooxygenase [Corynebacterium glutamicum]QDQ19497.1 LLM class flavin-dependent oxidoreductase [Corynebacterium glutamicum]QDQ23062.1 LLM class flavin-dependent oxidoreductase [Corynebacterium glutamicum]
MSSVVGEDPKPRLSVLDLVALSEGMTAGEAIAHSVRAAQIAEEHNYARFWVAEHHNSEGLASSATTLLMGHIAGHTSRIRVGSGGIMMPNHSALHVAEELGTLEAIYPGRIEAGLGRAPGTDPMTARELGRASSLVDDVLSTIVSLQNYLDTPEERPNIIAHPGINSRVPLFMLGSSLNGAAMAAKLDLPFAFASHFAPFQMGPAIASYRERAANPYVMAAANVLVCDTEEEAEFQISTLHQMFAGIVTNSRGKLAPPVRNLKDKLDPMIWKHIEDSLEMTFIGTAESVVLQLQEFADRYKLDEIITVTYSYDPEVRFRSIAALGTAWN